MSQNLHRPLLQVDPHLPADPGSSSTMNNMSALKTVRVLETMLANTDPSPILISGILTPIIPSLFAPSSYSIPNSFVPAPVLVHLLMSLVPCIVVECSDWRCRAEQGELEVARVARVKFLSRDACVREDIAVRSPPSRRAAVGPCRRGEQGNIAKRRTLQLGDAVARVRVFPIRILEQGCVRVGRKVP